MLEPTQRLPYSYGNDCEFDYKRAGADLGNVSGNPKEAAVGPDDPIA